MKRLVTLALLAALATSCGGNRPATSAPVNSAAGNTSEPTVLVQQTPDVPTSAPVVADTPAPAPTGAPEPTDAPAATPTAAEQAPVSPGVAPVSKKDCPTDHPIKGNIGDEKIYHVPTEAGYAQTNPEQCFATSRDAEAAGFRAVKR